MRIPGRSVAILSSSSSRSANRVGCPDFEGGSRRSSYRLRPGLRKPGDNAANLAAAGARGSKGRTIIGALAEIAINVECLPVQRMRVREITGEETSRCERAEAVRQRLCGPERSHQCVRFAQQALALLGAVGRQARSAGPQ